MAATLIKQVSQTVTAQNDAATILGFPSPAEVAVQITGTLSATITFEVTIDNTNWVSVELLPTTDLTDTALTATATAVGVFVSKLPMGVTGFRARCSAFTSATNLVVTARACFA